MIAIGLVVAFHLFGLPGVRFGLHNYRLDLDVYRIGAQVWLRGGPLYDPDFPVTDEGIGLPFTYPPLAAVLFTPLVLLPLAVDSALVTLVSVALLIAVAAAVLRAGAGGPARSGWWIAAAVPVVLLLEPVRSTLAYGQVNILLLAAVCFDCLPRRTRWRRGLLVGLVAAMKLTPTVFLLWFLVRGDRRALVTGTAAFLGFTGLGFLLAPRDSVQYWTTTLFETGRIGATWYAGNQNLLAVTSRLGLDGTMRTAMWVLAAAAVIALAAVAARRAVVAGEPALGLVLVAFGGLLASPTSWSHHWVWCVPALLVLGHLGRAGGHVVPRALAGLGLLIFLVGPQWLLAGAPDGELDWAPWQQVIGATYVAWALVLLGAAAVGVERWSAARAGKGGPPRSRSVQTLAVDGERLPRR